MSGMILCFNAGSSTIKFALYRVSEPEPLLLASGAIDNEAVPARVVIHSDMGEARLDTTLESAEFSRQLQWILDWLTSEFSGYRLVAAGHRVVHGGSEFVTPVLIGADVIEKLTTLTPLAPLHQPHNLAAIASVAEAVPGLPQVACFDTAFHNSNPPVATQFALPRALTEEGVRRYGFHGLSYEYIAGVLPNYASETAVERVIVAHLGSGASLCALYRGQSVASTMGFTALDGLPMAERCGALDPGVLLYLMKEKSMDYQRLTQLLYHQSGLLGVSGISGDLRVLEDNGSLQAREAVDLFVYRIGREIGSLAAALGGLEALVFTGGIGEHSQQVRAAVCDNAGWLGVDMDEAANRRGDAVIHSPASRVAVYVIPTDENRVIARATQRELAGA